MFFSLDMLDDIFLEASPELIKRVKSDIRKIRKVQRRERGFFKSLRITNKRILKAFSVYNSADDSCLFFESILDDWEVFVEKCIGENCAEILDWYI